eukprot:CAMPEP_0168344652 /NCGR_PEP_ID=MMETSP0213-20121227/16967_1 /TAXON_ID=151035 /ORGANISM="Euplotes harpa, Strain FSP1.4" /LENGTH=117 /DNA_ID=CAMNT_0008352481 /DNA_START=259 /DNA_END=610 /DNA_ORIENTATION=-
MSLLYWATTVVGLYSWCQGFSLKSFERYYYLTFVTILFGYVNMIVLNAVTTEEMWTMIVSPILNAIYFFYLLSVVYSMLLKKECEYRLNRKIAVKSKAKKQTLVYDGWSSSSEKVLN